MYSWGTCNTRDLTGLLIRFRTKRTELIVDIEKIFLQVRLLPEDRDVTRFLSLKDINQPPLPANMEMYHFARFLVGIISSPFLLGATIVHHLEQKGT